MSALGLKAEIEAAVGSVQDDLALARSDTSRRVDLGGKVGPWVVYGAGNMGRKLAAELKASGREVVAFVDKKKEGSVDGLPVVALGKARDAGLLDVPCALGLHNPMADASSIKRELMDSGFKEVWMPQEFVEALPRMGSFWLQPISALEELGPSETRAAISCFSDQESVRTIAAIARWRLLGRSDWMPEPDPKGQYFPSGLPPLPERLRMIDCGAYTGDTLTEALGRGLELDLYVGLEPDPSNYAKLVATAAAAGINASCVPCGAWDRAEMLAFLPSDAAGSVKPEMGNDPSAIRIQCLAIDPAFGALAPNFIKMDIEGAESRALAGAAGSIERHVPRLAVSSYHSAMDLWLLPTQMKSLMMRRGKPAPGMAIKCHAWSSFDSVIYAWAQ